MKSLGRITGVIVLLITVIFASVAMYPFFMAPVLQLISAGHSVFVAVACVLPFAIPVAVGLSYIVQLPALFALALMSGDGGQ